MQYRTSSFIVGAIVIILLFSLLSFGTYWLYQKVVSRPKLPISTPRPIALTTPTPKPSGFINPTPTPSPVTDTTPQTGGGTPAQLPATGLSGDAPEETGLPIPNVR